MDEGCLEFGLAGREVGAGGAVSMYVVDRGFLDEHII